MRSHIDHLRLCIFRLSNLDSLERPAEAEYEGSSLCFDERRCRVSSPVLFQCNIRY